MGVMVEQDWSLAKRCFPNVVFQTGQISRNPAADSEQPEAND